MRGRGGFVAGGIGGVAEAVAVFRVWFCRLWWVVVKTGVAK